MIYSVSELRKVVDELLQAWDTFGHPTQMSQPRARAGKPITTTDVARMECVIGLARHVHETARAIQLLSATGHPNSALPLVRLVYECALTATWLVQSKDDDGILAFAHEYARQRQGLQRVMKTALAQVFREGKVTGTESERFLGSTDNARRFDLVCEDLAPGGSDAYVLYRILSSYCHAGISVVDLYFLPPWDEETVPPPRKDPKTAIDVNLLLYLTSVSMVWGGRAVSYISKSKNYRSALRRIAGQLEIKSEIELSDAYWQRHAKARKSHVVK